QSDSGNEPLAIGGYVPLQKVYHFNPIPDELTEEESKYVLGAQANLWTEYITNEKQVEYMVFPRIVAMSEVVWSPNKSKDYPDFVARLENFHKRLDALDINYANHLHEIDGKKTANGYELSTFTKNKIIRYTTDGTEPNMTSEIYATAIPITKNFTLKAAVFNSEKQLGSVFTQPILFHKALGKEISLNVEPSKKYAGSGSQGLINGILGSNTRINDEEWLGFDGEDLEIVIDLGEETAIKTIETRFHKAPHQWIHAPKQMMFGVDINNMSVQVDLPENDASIQTAQINVDVTTRYIYLKIPNFGIIPEGYSGAGHKAWTFIDEIIVN
ncbi:MAG TPA: family 20 glycosylhydrolase, partial [Gelidibacter sp.]|uniref:family 20 glycosylhydrolase n=1 Tax=Gelidibacter sp. TaxID=2018083 RepID=UPI002B8F9E2C